MTWTNAGIIFNALLHCPFFIWFCLALAVIQIFRVEDPKFKEME